MRIAVYAGSFDPITLGHLSVVERGARLFDRLIVVVAVNPSKEPLFNLEERIALIEATSAAWANVSAASTAGYVVELARTYGARYLIRGVRGATDVEAEISLAHLNHALAPEIETVFVPAHPELSEVSSSRLKELARAGADLDHCCAPRVAEMLRLRLGPEASREARHG